MDVLGALADRYNPAHDYTTRPGDWVTERCDEFLWSAQHKIAQSVADHRYTAVYSAHDLGKTKIAADIIAWWIDCHPPGEAFVVSTAPTAAQVAAIMWREVTKLHNKVGLDGKINRAGYPMWYIGNELVGYGRKPADYEDSAFQGIHARYVLVVIDEACGVSKELFDQADALVTNEECRVLAIGNPTVPGSHFAQVCKPGSSWNVMHLDGLRSPNITKDRVIGHKSDGFGYHNPRYPLLAALMKAEGVPFSEEVVPDELRPLLISPLWIEERIRMWCGLSLTAHLDYAPDELADLVVRRCASSPIFVSRVRGQYPTDSTTGVIPLGWVEAAFNRWDDYFTGYNGPTSMLAEGRGRKIIGIDVAYSGEDETVFAVRYGNIIEKLHHYRIADTTEIADNAMSHLQEPHSLAIVDVQGIGAGVYDQLRRASQEGIVMGRAHPFNASAQSPKVDSIGQFRFRNDRAAAWWNFRELLDPSKGSAIALPRDDRLAAELTTVKYKHNVGGIIQIEAKEDIRKRLGRSTDSADAVIQAFWADAAAATVESYEWGAQNGSGAQPIPYGGYDAFTDRDLVAAPGFGSGSTFRGPGGMQGDLLGDWR